MLGLPKSTEISRQLPKKAIYAKFNLNTAARDRFDADVSRITIVNEISASTTNVAAGKTVSSFYVLLVSLKKKEYDKKTIMMLPRLIDQNILLVLDCGGEYRLAVFHGKILETEWIPAAEAEIHLHGLDLDQAWENVIKQIGDITVEEGRSLDEQIDYDDRRQKLEKEIARLERMARKEIQPKKKFELVQEINRLKGILEETYN